MCELEPCAPGRKRILYKKSIFKIEKSGIPSVLYQTTVLNGFYRKLTLSKVSVIIEHYLYLAAMGFAVISGVFLLMNLHKFSSKLPEAWQKSSPLKKFRWSITFLSIHLLIDLICELISTYLAKKGIYNNFVISIDLSLTVPFLFGFFLINMQSPWKRYLIIALYIVMIGYLFIGGYYHPEAVFSDTAFLFFDSVFFLGTLVHLTDLLVNPQSEYFKFQLKMNLSILIFSILSTFLSSIYMVDNPGIRIITVLHYANQIFFLFSFIYIFITEAFKLHRG